MPKSILVGDVGSTKSTWCYYTDAEKAIHLDGYNPLFHSNASREDLFDELHQRTSSIEFSDIWYYGAGVIDSAVANEIQQELKKIFPESQIHVSSDLLGAAIAACGFDAGTVAILGTGSHAAVFDGQNIIRQATSLGYILGDEGGGCDIGKSLLQCYFYNDMPEEISLEMKKSLPSGRIGLINELKSSPSPNQFLAQFAKVAVLYQEHTWMKDLVRTRFKLFVKRHIIPLSPIGPIHIVGSIGCIFASLFKEELEQAGLVIGKIIKEPAHLLLETHRKHEQ